MPWHFARIDERCGSCGRPIDAGDAIYAWYPGGFARGVRRVRCLGCGTSTFGPPPADGLSGDTTAPQPSFEPPARLPNVMTEAQLKRRREAAVARLNRWRERHGLAPLEHR